jgi:hypothetical protein
MNRRFMLSRDRWFDPEADVERAGTVLISAGGAYRVSGTTVTDASEINSAVRVGRNFNPWAVVSDWERDTSVRVLGRCPYADFQRVVLARAGPLGQERLYLDPRSHFPLKLASTEPNYFLGPLWAGQSSSASLYRSNTDPNQTTSSRNAAAKVGL